MEGFFDQKLFDLEDLDPIDEKDESPCPTPLRRNSVLAPSSGLGMTFESPGNQVAGSIESLVVNEFVYDGLGEMSGLSCPPTLGCSIVSLPRCDLQINFEGPGHQAIDDIVEIKVNTEVTLKIAEEPLNEELLFLLRRTRQYPNVEIEGESKFDGEDEQMKFWPFRLNTIRGIVAYEPITIEGDTTHYGARVIFNNNNEATLSITKIGIRLTTNEKATIKKPHSSKIWELQIIDPNSKEIRAAVKIQVLAELRQSKKRKLIEEPRNATRMKVAPSNDDWGETILSFFCINDSMVTPLGVQRLAKLNEEELLSSLSNDRATIKNVAKQMILNNFGFSDVVDFVLDDIDLSIAVKTLSSLGETIFDKQHGGPIEALHDPEWIEPLRDRSGKKYHVIKVTANVKAMMEALNNNRQHNNIQLGPIL